MISGPGGVGKGTVVRELLERDPQLWLSRSWTTRDRRPGEADDAYRFATREEFERHAAADGFLEWAEFLGNLYGTPRPDAPEGRDVVLEIDVQGAEQVAAADPEALLVFMVAPSVAEQEARLRGRGDREEQVARRVAVASEEGDRAVALGAQVIVNAHLDDTVDALLDLIRTARDARRRRPRDHRDRGEGC